MIKLKDILTEVNIKYKYDNKKHVGTLYSEIGYTKEAIRAINKFKTKPLTIKDIDLSDIRTGSIPSYILVTLSNGNEYTLGFNYDAGVWWIYDGTGRKSLVSKESGLDTSNVIIFLLNKLSELI